jgi:PTS system galactitol-specific IIC component
MSVINYILGLGSSVMLAIIIFILCLCFRVKLSTTIRSSLMIGVAFWGINLVIGGMMGVFSPLTQAFIERTGINLSVTDIGWSSASSITWAWPAAGLFIPIGILVNVVMLLLKKTTTVDVDIWNYWVWGFSGAIIGVLTNSVFWGMVAFIVTEIIILVIADKTAPQIHEYFGLEGISIPHGNAAPFTLYAYVLNKIFDHIPGLNKVQIDTQAIVKKVGVFGEPVFMGFAIGLLLSIMAGLSFKDILTNAVALAAVMVILPRMCKMIMEALGPVSTAIGDKLKAKFPGREFNIGLDVAILAGNPDAIAVSFLLIPVSIVLAMILPGNRLLPFADLSGISFVIAMTLPIYKGNAFRTFLGGIVIVISCLYIGTAMAPLFTQLAINAGVAIPEGATGVMSFLSGTSPITYLMVLIAKIFVH